MSFVIVYDGGIIRRFVWRGNRVQLGEFDVWIMLERLKDPSAFRRRHLKDANVDLRDRIHLAGTVRGKNCLDRLFRQVRDRSDQDLVWHRRLSERRLGGEPD